MCVLGGYREIAAPRNFVEPRAGQLSAIAHIQTRYCRPARRAEIHQLHVAAAQAMDRAQDDHMPVDGDQAQQRGLSIFLDLDSVVQQ